MMSMHNVGSAGQALHYFSKDNYYTTDQGLEHSAWFGKGAATLGLNGQVDRHEFFKLLSGQVGGEQLGRVVLDENGEPEVVHRPGIDLTFSAPKSVSIAAEVFEDRDVRLAHEDAVKEALEYVEAYAAQARKTVDGQTVTEETGNVVVALFRHNTSRDLDPDTHTHALVMNATQRSDGEWRSLTNDALYVQQKVIGAVYTSSLARGLQKRGYAITAPDKNGNFELVGVTREQIEHFSQRSAARDRWLRANGIDPANATPAEKERAVLATRERKVGVDHEALAGQWRARAAAVELDYSAIQQKAREAREAGTDARVVKLSGLEALRFSAAHLGEREIVLNQYDLVQTALEHSVGRTSPNQIFDAYKKLIDQGKIVDLPDGNITTEKMLNTERSTVENALAQRDATPAIAPAELVRSRIEQAIATARTERNDPTFDYTSGQRGAIEHALTSKDRIVAVQGLAGVGKTTMVKGTVQVAHEQGWLVRGMAATGQAAKQLENDSGIQADTVTMFEIHEQRRQDDLKLLREYAPDLARERELWLVDESSFLSQRQMARLFKMAERADAKVILLGDRLQLQAIEAGKPFEILQDEGVSTAQMTQIQRQRNPELQQAVAITVGTADLAPDEPLTDLNLVRNGRAFDFLREAGRVTEEKEPKDLIELLAKEYVDRGAQRKETIIITPFNEDRVDINNAVRTLLQERGELDVNDSAHTIFRSEADMTRAKQKEAQYYTKDMTVRFGRDYQKILASRGEYMRVSSTRPDEGIVVLRKGDGTLMEWEPKKYNRVEVYLSETRNLAARDVIRFTRGDELVKNGHEATVVSVEANRAVLRLADGKEIPWDLDAQRHWDHAYAATVHAGQGATRQQAMLHIPSHKMERDPEDSRRQSDVAMTVRRIFGDRSFYVGLTRAVEDLQVFTTDAGVARLAVTRHQDKSSAVETLREHEVAEQANTQPQRQRRQQAAQQMQIEPD
ncbi:MobF family relaxase [Burkholderia contaminans]|uniref:Conjugative relaxase n=1 Tax=Burkholderia contaminans TaxID=488447 RepID=A0A3N8QEL4_9BURK|nr:MobF family relaxase [Burkholderia contaminans]RQT22071.1 conjugative relaxase [Burkholderia contaminans]